MKILTLYFSMFTYVNSIKINCMDLVGGGYISCGCILVYLFLLVFILIYSNESLI